MNSSNKEITVLGFTFKMPKDANILHGMCNALVGTDNVDLYGDILSFMVDHQRWIKDYQNSPRYILCEESSFIGDAWSNLYFGISESIHEILTSAPDASIEDVDAELLQLDKDITKLYHKYC